MHSKAGDAREERLQTNPDHSSIRGSLLLLLGTCGLAGSAPCLARPL